MQEQEFKNPPEVRAYLSRVKRDYRAKKKAEAAKGLSAKTATAPDNPTVKEGKPNNV